MTQNILESTKIPSPQRPWKSTRSQKMQSVALIIGALTISIAGVALTPLKGKLGYFVLFFFSYLILSYIRQRSGKGSAAGRDAILECVAIFAMTITIIPIISIVSTVVFKGYKGLHAGLLTKDMALASVNDPIVAGGLSHALLGTTLMVFGALVISFPIGVLTALYLTEIKGKFSRPIKILVQAMSGVPSIVAGLFILSSVVYPITGSLSGSMGSLALCILMIPTIARTAEEVLLLIPNDLREAGTALGGTQWRTVAMVVVPAAKSGLVTATILGVARIIGETAPVLLITGGGDANNLNLFSGAMGSLPYYIWKAFLTGGTEEALARAWAGMLVLLVFIFILFASARYISGRKVK